MRLTRHAVGLVGAVLVAAVACSGDGTGVDGNGGNGAAPTLSGDVQPIFTQRCALSGCHIGGTSAQPTGKPMDLSSATLTIQNTVSVPALQVPSLFRVNPGNPDDSYLIAKLEGRAGQLGGEPTQMPLDNCCLSQDQINTIRAWISAGALSN